MTRIKATLIGSAIINAAIVIFVSLIFYPHFSIQNYLDGRKHSHTVVSSISPSYQGSIDLYKFDNALFELGAGEQSLQLDDKAVRYFNVINGELESLTNQKDVDRAIYIAQRLMGNRYPEFESLRLKVAKFQPQYDELVNSEGFGFNQNDINKIKALQQAIFDADEVTALFADTNRQLESYSQTSLDMFNVSQRGEPGKDESN